MAALLTIEAANTDKLAMYLGECRELGVPILPPDINASELAFTVEPGRACDSAGRGQERRRRGDPVDPRRPRALGRIDSLYTLCEHVDLRLVNKRVLESLIKAGACDFARAKAAAAARRAARGFRGVDRAIEHGGRHQRDRDKGQSQLFGGAGDDASAGDATAPCPTRPAWTEAQQLAGEKRKRSAST